MSTLEPPAAVSQPPDSETPSLLGRAIAIFVRPARAWAGLETRAQWWFPLLIMIVLSAAGAVLLHDRAMIPMMREQWDEQIASGQMSADQADRVERFMSGPVGLAFFAGQQVISWPLITLALALVVWFGVGFVLGTRMKYRHALEVVSWSWLVSIPAYLITVVLAWQSQTFKGIHVGFAALLPASDTPSKIHTALGVLLDSVGPLSIWHLTVAILGAAALSQAPRKSVAWVLSGLYLVLMLFFAGLAALFAPGT